MEKIELSEKEWKAKLSEEEYRILREKGTERAFTGKFWNHFENGTYICAGCDSSLFESNAKFDSHCGWPSFDKSKTNNVVEEHMDLSFGMKRIEITCSKCGGHLGHVFNDGPTSTGLRYCINSVAIKFIDESDKS